MMMRMSECEKPWFCKKVITESGLSGVLKRTCLLLKAVRADSCDSPKLLMRYDTENGCVFDSDSDSDFEVAVMVQKLLSEIENNECWLKLRLLNFGVVDFVVMKHKTTLLERKHVFNMVWNAVRMR